MALPNYRLRYTNISAREVVRQKLPQMEIEPEYQRGHVWTNEQRRELVKSWVMGVPTGNITINLRDNPGWRENYGDVYEEGKCEDTWIIYGCVDGKQRIETARMWFEGELRVPRAWFAEHDIDALGGPEGLVSYRALTKSMQRHQGTAFQFSLIEAQLPTVTAEAELFLLVNGGGTAQEPKVMERARKLAGR